jgi:hypothetical protein
MDSSIKALHKNIAEWLAGPSGSVCLHVALILALIFLVDFSKDDPPTPPPIDITYLDIAEIPPDLIPPEPTPDRERTDVDPDVPAIEIPDVDIDMVMPPEIVDFMPSDPMVRSLEALEIPMVPSLLVVKNLAAGPMQGRLGAEGHAEAGRQYGGDHWVHAEVSVKRALEWLRLNQNADGSWGTSDREAYAGLGILTFLAHGDTTASEAYGDTVRRALQYLLARQNDAGEFARTDTTGGTYAQAICVYAVSEAYGMTRIPSLREPMEKGVQVLIDGQQPNGGFDYRFAKGPRRDTSLGGWCSQAFKAAFIAGSENPRLKNAMDLAVADMKSAQREDGRFFYTDRGSHSTHSITAVGLLSLQLLGQSRSADVRRGLSALDDARCDWRNPPAWPMYAWYYLSQVKFHQGGGSWRSWNNQFAPAFIRNQNPDGSWLSAGLAIPAGTTGRENYHPVYSTTLAALSLQVYYRLLPTYQPIRDPVETQATDEEVRIRIL